ncbi:MAG: tetratricopeptide repeat protein, partial [Bacteroidia bacterium]|nr:tetratricopeptide repeat protein [Bacteroidia bacterium]
MEGSFGFHDYEEQHAKQSAREFERMLREDSYAFLDLVEVDQIYQYYLRSNDLKKAEQLIGYALQTHPSSADLYQKKAQIAVEKGAFEQALDFIDHARHLAPSEIEFLHFHADILAQVEDYEGAIQLLKDHILQADQPEEFLLQMGNIAQIARLVVESEKYYRDALELDPEFEDALYELAFLLESEDRTVEAIQLYHTYLDDYPYSSAVWYHLGNLLRKIGNYEMGLEAYEFVLAIDEDFGPAHFARGQVLMEL